MEPITAAVASAWTITKTAGEITKKLFELGKKIKDRDIKMQVDVITDELRELKHKAGLLEDENRDLREKLRFNSDEYEFRTPFYYAKAHPEQALCPRCFVEKEKAAPMGAQGQGVGSDYRLCLVCREAVEVSKTVRQSTLAPRRGGWMG